MIIAALILAIISLISLLYTMLVIMVDGSDTAIRVGLYCTVCTILGALLSIFIYLLKLLIIG